MEIKSYKLRIKFLEGQLTEARKERDEFSKQIWKMIEDYKEIIHGYKEIIQQNRRETERLEKARNEDTKRLLETPFDD